MNISKKQHYFFLAGILILSAALRFTGLDSKPLWLDEIITTLFSLGHSFDRIPLDRIVSLAELPDIFTFNPQATCQTIAETVARESTHPPVFFCWLNQWLSKMSETATLQEIVWYVRSLPAFFGVLAVAAIYLLGRVAFSPSTGLVAAALMAVSPFAVYLSQEARHYTLPLLLITLALIALIQIQQDFTQNKRVRPTIALSWFLVNTIGLYIHYFFILALAAQIGAILLWNLWQIQKNRKTEAVNIVSVIQEFLADIWRFSFCLFPFILFLPWFPILLEHFTRPETAWFKPFEPSWLDNIVPIYQIIMGWVVMTIALPVENQPLWIAIPCGLLMLAFTMALSRTLWQNLPKLFRSKALGDSSVILGSFTLLILGEFLFIVYILGKDITSAIRYYFLYYPSICVLLAASLTLKIDNKLENSSRSLISKKYSTILVGLLSSILVISGLVFQKPYNPEAVTKHLNLEPEKPLMVMVGYDTFQEVALGLGFAWELYHQRNQNLSSTSWIFLDRTEGYQTIWPKLATLQTPRNQFLNLWAIAPGLRQKEYPPNLSLSSSTCTLDPNQYYRLGIPYQLYRCSANP